ncbi:uncharacterized protein F5147DRAFT_658738 [Suillus discolor]|uniref:Uncharacterized protein n=1 Tax=Suillus discolor TaxID=1912936 RepID=A0A9P7EU34_9AGAM|nr:uncharacterized protein F5147DRAFT_658738 [Suillus discolor]KAG2088270.1 hypothetical protein F5147DRAFT_658738 [Suillus discolor]
MCLRYSNERQSSRTLGDPGSGGITELYDVVDAIGLMTIDDVDNLEANLIMDLTRARHDVFNAEKTLANCVVREHEVMTNLSKYKSAISKWKLDKADVGLGHMHITFKKHGLSHCSMPPDFHDAVRLYVLSNSYNYLKKPCEQPAFTESRQYTSAPLRTVASPNIKVSLKTTCINSAFAREHEDSFSFFPLKRSEAVFAFLFKGANGNFAIQVGEFP